MSACDNKLKSNLVEAMELDNQRLEAEMQDVAPHTFSDIHEKTMEKTMRIYSQKSSKSRKLRFIVAACLALLLTGSIFIIGSKDLSASKLSIDIIEWLEEFFSTEKGTDDRRKEGVLFEESRIGYLPDGFTKVEEYENFSLVYFRFQNDNGNDICISIGKARSMFQIDGVEVVYEVGLNEAKYEYTATYQEQTNKGTIVWQDDRDIYYYVSGTVMYGELINVMNGITY